MKLLKILLKTSSSILFFIVFFMSCKNSHYDYNQIVESEYISTIHRNDSLIVNEFYFDTKEDNTYKCSHLFTPRGYEEIFINKSPFISFFSEDIVEIEISLFEDNGIDIDSVSFTYTSKNNNDLFLTKTNDHLRQINKKDLSTLFKNIVLVSTDSFGIEKFDINIDTKHSLDSIIKENRRLDLSADDIIDSLSKHPFYFKNRAFINFVQVKMRNAQGKLLTIYDCSEELPTGVIWILKTDENYLQCYNTRIMDFVRSNISDDHPYSKYLTLEWTLYLQYLSSTY